jgi:hypothetical protein
MSRLLFGLLWLGLMGTALGVDPQPPAKNLLNWGNLDGQLQDSGLPAGWTVWPPGYKGYDCYTVATPVHSGTRSLRLSASEPWASVVTGQHRLEPGTRQFGQAWVQLPAGSTCEAWLRIDYLRNGLWIGSAPVTMLRGVDKPAAGWHLLKTDATGEPFPEANQFQLIAGVHGGGTAFWDDLELSSSTDVGK